MQKEILELKESASIDEFIHQLPRKERKAGRNYAALISFGKNGDGTYDSVLKEAANSDDDVAIGRLICLAVAIGHKSPSDIPSFFDPKEARRLIEAAKKAVQAEYEAIQAKK
jgi:hypothetical protein